MTLRKRLYGEEPQHALSPPPLTERVAEAEPTAEPAPGGAPADGYRGDPEAAELNATFQRSWHQPEQLHEALATALDAGWHPSLLLDAAERLRDIDPRGERSCAMYASVLMRAGHAARAERLLATFVDVHGPSPAVLLRLARAYEAQGKVGFVERALWRAVEFAPNDEQVLDAWCRMHQAAGGDRAMVEALRRACTVLCAWRPPMLLAFVRLYEGAVEAAVHDAGLAFEIVDRSDLHDAAALLAQLLDEAQERLDEQAAAGNDENCTADTATTINLLRERIAATEARRTPRADAADDAAA